MAGKEAVDSVATRRLRDELRRHLPWLRDEIFDLRSKGAFKDNFAMALCCALPVFDLVIVDEAHNLKHGFGEDVSSRNRVLGLALGHSDAAADGKLFQVTARERSECCSCPQLQLRRATNNFGIS